MKVPILAVLASAVAFTGCAPQTTQNSVTTTSEGERSVALAGKSAADRNMALVRFMNADPQSQAINLDASEKRLFSAVAYKAVSPYVEAPRGYTQFKLIAGEGADIAATRRELFPGRHYTVVSLPRYKGKARLVTMSDNLGSVDPGEARIRLINGTLNVDDLGIYLAGSDVRVVHAPRAGSFTTFTDIEPGDIEVRPSRQAPPMHLSMLPIKAGRQYTFVVIDSSAPGTPFDVVQVEDRQEQ